MKKWFWLFTGALFVQTGQLLFAEEAVSLQESTMTVVSSGTVLSEPFVWPLPSVIGGRRTRIVSKFGPRKVPGRKGMISTSTVTEAPVTEPHEGIDFAVPAKTNIRAARSGKVLFAGYSKEYVSRQDKMDKNHLIIVRHEDGKSTRYVHMDRLLVKPGQSVKAGDVLGLSSASDEWTEPVVHFEIRESNGKALDPLSLLVEPPKPVPQ